MKGGGGGGRLQKEENVRVYIIIQFGASYQAIEGVCRQELSV